MSNTFLSMRPDWSDITSITQYFLYIGVLWLGQAGYLFLVELMHTLSGGFSTNLTLILQMIGEILAIAAFLSLLYPAMIIRSRALLFGAASFVVTRIVSIIVTIIIYGAGYRDIKAGIEEILSNPQTASLGMVLTLTIAIAGLLILVGLVLLLVGLYKFSDIMGEYIIILGWFVNLISLPLGTILVGIGFIHLAKSINNTISRTGIIQLKSIISNQLEKTGMINLKNIEKSLLIPRAVIYLTTTSMIKTGELNATIDGLNIVIASQSQTKI